MRSSAVGWLTRAGCVLAALVAGGVATSMRSTTGHVDTVEAPAVPPRLAPADVGGTTSAQVWQMQARRAMLLADEAARSRGANAAVWANLARASARLEGWRSPRTVGYVQAVLRLRHRDGGWGIDEPSDVFDDGTVNPATATYTVATADHVGQLLLEGYDAGVVPRSYLVGARDSLWGTPRVRLRTGACVAYSTSRWDVPTPRSRCVNNANVAAAWFLREAARRGVDRPGQRELAAAMLRHDDGQYEPTAGLFRYGSSETSVQDVDHNGLNVEAHVALGQRSASSVGGRSLAAMTARSPQTPLDPLGLMRVAALDPGTCHRRAVLAGKMIQRVPRLTAEATFDHPYLPAVRYSQTAVWAARNGESCPSRLVHRPPGRLP